MRLHIRKHAESKKAPNSLLTNKLGNFLCGEGGTFALPTNRYQLARNPEFTCTSFVLSPTWYLSIHNLAVADAVSYLPVKNDMGKPKFYLRTPNSRGECLIQMSYRFAGMRIYYSTKKFVKPENWNEETQRAKGPHSKDLNFFLKRLANEAERYFLRGESRLSVSGMREHLDQVTGFGAKRSSTLFEYIDRFITERLKNPRYKVASIHVYGQTREKLKAFNPGLDFEDLDRKFFKAFTNWLWSRGYAESTIHKTLTTLRTILNEALADQETDSARFRAVTPGSLGVSKSPKKGIYLTMEEIARLRAAKFDRQALDRARDLLLIAVYTSLRYSDLHQVNRSNVIEVKGVKCFEIKTMKTGAKVTIPIHRHLYPILDKYDWEPTVPSNPKLNQLLKDVGRAVIPDKADRLTTHVGRATFITLASALGVPERAVMAIVGHKSHLVHRGYDKREREEFALELSESIFFKQ